MPEIATSTPVTEHTAESREPQFLSDQPGDGSGQTYHPLLELTLIRILEFWREKEAVFWVFVFPVLLACALGIAFRNTTPEKIHVVVESSGHSEADERSQAATAAVLSRSADIDVVTLSQEEASRALRSGRASIVVLARDEIGHSEENSDHTKTPDNREGIPGSTRFKYQYDPTRPESRAALLAVDKALSRGAGQPDVINAQREEIMEPGARYIDFLIPGLIGLNLMGSGMWGLGFTIVTARGRKLLKRFAATPMRRSDYLLSFILSRLVFLVLEVAAVLIFGWLVFGVTVRGSFVSVAIISMCGALAFSGLGLLVAARPVTIEGVSGLMNLVMLPMWLLSGTFFSSDRFPQFLQPAIKALPLTAVNDSLRAVINDGASLSSMWVAVIVLLAWAFVSFAIALRMFRWQ